MALICELRAPVLRELRTRTFPASTISIAADIGEDPTGARTSSHVYADFRVTIYSNRAKRLYSGGRAEWPPARPRGGPGGREAFAELRKPKPTTDMLLTHGKLPSSAAVLSRSGLRVYHRHHHRGGRGDRANSSPAAKSRILRSLCSKGNEAAAPNRSA
jgi:hypothetical protein